MRRSIFFLFVLLSSVRLAYSQTHFTRVGVGNGPTQMNFNVLAATINGTNLQTNDEVAVFDGIYCVGVQVVTSPGSYIYVIAQEDHDPNNPEIDGYTIGHTATLKIWDASEEIEITDINLDIVSGSMIFQAGASAWLNLSVLCPTVNPPIIGTVTQPDCAVATGSVELISLPSSGTWTLTRTPGGVTTPGTGSSILISGLSPGTYSWTITTGWGCASEPSLDVTINDQPEIPGQPGAISGLSEVCQNSAHTYSITPVDGATSYTWLLPSGWTGTSTTTSINATAGANGGTVSVRSNNICGSSSYSTLSVTVTPLAAQPGTITGEPSVCQGSSQTYSISPVSGADNYTWTLPSGWTGTSTSTSITTTVGATSGNVSVASVNSCGTSNARTLYVTVSTVPIQPGSISGSSPVCQGSSQTYSISPVSGADNYTWTLPPGWTGTSTSTSINVIVGASGGTISVTANNNICGSSSPRTRNVTVSTSPGQPGSIAGEISVCQGSSQTYSISPVSGATTYTWSLPSGWTGTSTSTSINATAGANGGTVSVRANNTCGSSSFSTLSVSVTPLAAQPGTITGETSVCEGSSQTYSISPVSGADNYTWTLPSGWTGTSTSTSITATVSATSGNVSVASVNSCGTSNARTLYVTVSTVPPQPGNITGSSSVCQGSSQTYSISPVSGADNYTWTLPTGWTGTSTSTSITTTVGANGGTVSVRANNSCGSSTSRTLNVFVSTVPNQPGSITGETSVCQGSSQTYSISPVSGADNYTWTLPTGWTGTSNTTSINVTVGTNGGNVSVTANNSCGSSTIRSRSVTVSAIPSAPITSLIQPTCETATGTITVTSPAGSGMTFSIDGTTYSNTSGVFSNVSSGSYTVTARNSAGCTSQGTSVTINIQPATPPTPIITEDNGTLHSSAASGNQWYNQTGPINGANGQDYIPSQTDDYYVIVTDGDCSSAPSNIIHVVITDVEKTQEGDAINLYPNPNTGRFTLTFTGDKSEEILLEVLNNNGQTLRSDKIVTSKYEIEVNLEELPKGTYFIRIFYSGKSVVKKVILQ